MASSKDNSCAWVVTDHFLGRRSRTMGAHGPSTDEIAVRRLDKGVAQQQKLRLKAPPNRTSLDHLIRPDRCKQRCTGGASKATRSPDTPATAFVSSST